MNLGKRFKKFRESFGLTQKEAAVALGIKYYQLGNYETNRSEPNIATLKKMSILYETSIDELVGNNEIFEPITDAGKIIDENGYVDLEELAKSLKDIAEKIEKEAK